MHTLATLYPPSTVGDEAFALFLSSCSPRTEEYHPTVASTVIRC
ncbi:hypothetical protein RIEGSTA812A_PEG_601 [invertebrate metagenome]|uniref:Uncharacterized protein n=1 Tax=invertebrate metagenome TaxID=1711999 RepID=A0A484HAI8_9ZZZZ